MDHSPRASDILHFRRLWDLHRPSLLRANLIVFGSLAAAFLISGFTPTVPLIRATLWQILPLTGGLIGMAETARCIRRHWSLVHAAVVLFLYCDLMILMLLTFLLLYPFMVRK